MKIGRKAQSLADFDAICSLAALISPSPGFNWPAAKLKTELSLVETLVLEMDQKIVSFLCYRDLGDLFEISVLGTHPQFFRQGYQSDLIKCLQVLAAKQQRRIILEVHLQNEEARPLYLKLGFLEIHRRKNYYPDGGCALVLDWNNKAGCGS